MKQEMVIERNVDDFKPGMIRTLRVAGRDYFWRNGGCTKNIGWMVTSWRRKNFVICDECRVRSRGHGCAWKNGDV